MDFLLQLRERLQSQTMDSTTEPNITLEIIDPEARPTRQTALDQVGERVTVTQSVVLVVDLVIPIKVA